MKDCATMMFNEFVSRLDAHEVFYLKGTDRRIYLKRSYNDGYILADQEEAFLNTADFFTVSALDDRILYFFDPEANSVFYIRRDMWEVDADD